MYLSYEVNDFGINLLAACSSGTSCVVIFPFIEVMRRYVELDHIFADHYLLVFIADYYLFGVEFP